MKRTYLDLSREEVDAVVRYEPETGAFYWVNTVARVGCGKGYKPHRAGEIASRKASGGYLAVTINSVPVLCHRLAWFMAFGYWPVGDVDHANGCRADNRMDNLRQGTRSFNMQNLRKAHCDTSSGLIGAYFDKRRGHWVSRISKDGRTKSLGSFASAMDAHNAYVTAKRSFHEGCTI